MRCLVTGATGFIGRFLCEKLLADGHRVQGTLLESEAQSPSLLSKGIEPVVIQPIGPDTDWDDKLTGVDAVIHLAARVHIMNDHSHDPIAEFRRVNTDGTAKLAQVAAKSDVKRFVFVSSIKVNGEESLIPYNEDSSPHSTDPYGISKWEAEQALRHIEAETGLEVVVVRPTLVFGPGVKANFLNMMKVVKRGIPLPLGSINNRRSMVYVGNLADALATCAAHPAAAGKTYMVSDGEDVSTPELVRRTADALAAPARLFPVPCCLLKTAGKLTGKSAAVSRLTGSLTVDGSKIRQELDWKPPFTMEEGLRVTAEWFLKQNGGES